jgi:hypothetical protein
MQQRMGQSQRGQADRQGRQPGQQGQGQPQAQGQQPGQSQQRRSPAGSQSQDGRSAGRQAEQNPQSGRPGFNGDVRGPSGDSTDTPAGAGGFRNGEERQLSRELRQRVADAEEMRPLLDRNSTQMQNLEKVIESLRRAGDYMNYNDPEQIARLKSAIDYMRKVEFDLARELDRLNQKDKYLSAEDNEAPGNYQKLVEEYYKSIAKAK